LSVRGREDFEHFDVTRRGKIVTAKILVTGASGNVGREVVSSLLTRGAAVRVAVLDTDDASKVSGETVEKVRFDFGAPETWGPALAGVERMFLMRPPAIADVARYVNPVVDAAQAAGVQQIAFLSLLGVNPRTPHWQVEQKLQASSVPYTLLQPSFFMQNLNTFYAAGIRERDEIYLPAGRGKTSFVDVRDIGAAAAVVLTQPGHTGRAYELTGPEALDYTQVADIFTRVLGRQIRYARPTPAEYARRLREQGYADEFVQVQGMLYFPVRMGWGAKITPEVAQLLGRRPYAMAQYVADYADCWRPALSHAPAERPERRWQPVAGLMRLLGIW
jgi:uncharacterized protein YbjT (DUF2867 family)